MHSYVMKLYGGRRTLYHTMLLGLSYENEIYYYTSIGGLLQCVYVGALFCPALFGYLSLNCCVTRI